MRSTRKGKASTIVIPHENRLKRKFIDEEDDLFLDPVTMESDDEVSMENCSGNLEGLSPRNTRKMLILCLLSWKLDPKP